MLPWEKTLLVIASGIGVLCWGQETALRENKETVFRPLPEKAFHTLDPSSYPKLDPSSYPKLKKHSVPNDLPGASCSSTAEILRKHLDKKYIDGHSATMAERDQLDARWLRNQLDEQWQREETRMRHRLQRK